MKKVILALVMTSVIALADATTIDATMKLMKQGMDDIQSGFLYNSKATILKGVDTVENANAIFSRVDVSTFIAHNNKVQVTKNINKNLAQDLAELKKAVSDEKYSKATASYGNVVNDCLSCHIIIRGW